MTNLLTRDTALFGRVGLFGGGELISGTTAPKSGTSGTPYNAPPASVYIYNASGSQQIVYINEGTATAPYWTPLTWDQPGLRAWHTEFKDHVGKALANTDASTILASGIRVHGQGIAETDSGLTIAAAAEEGARATLVATDEDGHVAALGVGTGILPFQPDVHGPIVVECEFAHVTAITLRATFLGFIGAAVDALDPVVTGATTTLTLVLDDLVGMFQDAGLTDSDGIFMPHNKSNAAASIATTATGVDLSQTIAAAGTFQRWRVEVDASGNALAFINKVQVGSISAALDADEETYPSFYIESTSAATKAANVRRFSTWGLRA